VLQRNKHSKEDNAQWMSLWKRGERAENRKGMCNELGLFEMLADHSNVFRFSKKNGVIGTNLPYQKRLCLPYPSPL
jgi:hypothetical protein